MPNPVSVESASFNPDASLLVLGSGDGFAEVVDSRRGALLLRVGGSAGPLVSSATFSTDGSKLLLSLGLAGAVLYDCPGCSPSDLERRARNR